MIQPPSDPVHGHTHIHRHHLQLVADPATILDDAGHERVRAAMHAGLDSVQVRGPGSSAREMVEAARRLLPAASSQGVVVIVNDRADVALALLPARRAARGGLIVPVGVHLGARSLPVALVRRHLPLPFVGVSVHTVEEGIAAVRDGADYLTFGHVFPTASHPGEPPAGLDPLHALAGAVEVPVFAIGGIDASNVREVLHAGASGIAVISAILDAPDPAAATSDLRAILDGAEDDARHRIGPA
ncbi:MAG: thiamine phosphate synthase [Thermomicrobiales bacterium]